MAKKTQLLTKEIDKYTFKCKNIKNQIQLKLNEAFNNQIQNSK